MKNSLKPKNNKSSHKGLSKKAPVFKKPKSTGKLVLPKKIEIDENTIKKTTFDKKKVKLEKKNKKGKSNNTEVKPANGNVHKNQLETIVDVRNEEQESKTESKKTKRQPKNTLPSKYITDEVATKAVLALEKLAKLQKKNRIFEEEAPVLAQINCIKIQSRKTTLKIVLPHCIAASTGEICLITTDLKKGRKHDHEPSVDHWEDVLRKAGVTQVKTVLPMRQLRVEYDQFELKRRLLTQHDLILVDSRIHGHVCHILGKIFKNKHNMLIPVRLHDVKDIKKSIEKSLNVSLLHLSEGLTSSVTIGHMGMSVKQLKENLLGLVKQLAAKFPGGEMNIRSLDVKLPLSLAIPVYVTLRSKKMVGVPKVRSDLPKSYATVEGELTTILGSSVKVTPDGNISLKRNAEEYMSENEEELEELSDGEDESPKPKNTKQKTKLAKESNDDSSEEEEENPKPKKKKQNVKVVAESNEDLSDDDDEPKSIKKAAKCIDKSSNKGKNSTGPQKKKQKVLEPVEADDISDDEDVDNSEVGSDDDIENDSDDVTENDEELDSNEDEDDDGESDSE